MSEDDGKVIEFRLPLPKDPDPDDESHDLVRECVSNVLGYLDEENGPKARSILLVLDLHNEDGSSTVICAGTPTGDPIRTAGLFETLRSYWQSESWEPT